MDTLPTTDLFKFVSARPPQRRPDPIGSEDSISDARVHSEAGAAKVTRLANRLATTESAMSMWQDLDRRQVLALASAYRKVRAAYEDQLSNPSLGTDPADAADTPTGAEVIIGAGLNGERIRIESVDLTERSWDALYIAYATGPFAGERLQQPTTALQLLHFIAFLTVTPRPTPSVALSVLSTPILIPPTFHGAWAAARPATEPPPTPPTTPPTQGGELAKLAQEVASSEAMFDELSLARPLLTPVVHSRMAKAADRTEGQFDVRTIPTVAEALSAEPRPEFDRLLSRLRIDPSTPANDAARLVYANTQRLTRKTAAVVNEPAYQNYLATARMNIAGLGDIAGAYIPPNLSGDDPGTAPDVDVSGKIKPLGIGDLKVVKQTLIKYEPGEIAHIENVLSGESKVRKHRKLDRSESTVFTSDEEVNDTERDSQTTDRFELKNETEKTMKEDMSVKAGLTVTATLGPVITTATGDFAYATSKQESQKSAANFAREVVDRSVSKVQTRHKVERTTKTIAEVEEINDHSLTNDQPGATHIRGIYRWVDKRYRAQIYNYGVRLLLEFVIPEPAAYWRTAQRRQPPKNVSTKPPAPFVNDNGKPLTVADISESSYQKYVSRYGVSQVEPPPPMWASSSSTVTKDSMEDGKTSTLASKDAVVPDGYELYGYTATVSSVHTAFPKIVLHVGSDSFVIRNQPGGPYLQSDNKQGGTQGGLSEYGQPGPVTLSVVTYDVNAIIGTLEIVAIRRASKLEKWKLDTFEKISTAYQTQQKAYDQALAQADVVGGIIIEGRNPAINRDIEKTELKKLCLTLLTGQHFGYPRAMTDYHDDPVKHPEINIDRALHEGRIAKFLEQAFEWEQITYLFYPYFHGRKKHWVENGFLSDPDPMFEQFLRAGAARVVVPVPIAYVNSVLYMLQNAHLPLADRVWGGGPVPTLEDPLYKSIADELKDQTDDLAGAKPEGKPWEFTIPTTLVWLQPDGSLPSFS